MIRGLFEFKNGEQAAVLQSGFASEIVEESPPRFRPRRVCGIDMAYRDDRGFASAVVWDIESATVVSSSHASGKVDVGYVPGFLGFREGPMVARLARRIGGSTNVFLVDGHGRVHPRRFGLACHVGLALQRPTIGVAKSRFYGREEGENIVGADGELLGKMVETNGRTLYVSVGNLIGLDDAVHIVRGCIVDRDCVPLREAHLGAARLRRAS
jgi:deoxyribonuclease V